MDGVVDFGVYFTWFGWIFGFFVLCSYTAMISPGVLAFKDGRFTFGVGFVGLLISSYRLLLLCA